MTTDFKILQWSGAFDGPWSAIGERRYRDEGFDGLSITGGQGWNPPNLEFLHELDRLRFFSAHAKVRNDLAAFTVASLEELVLATGSNRRVPDVAQSVLRSLVVMDRPGLDVAEHWPALESLRIGTWRGTDLHLLGTAEELGSLHIEGRRQSGSLEGIETCPSLREIVIVDYSIASSSPLRQLRKLTNVSLMAAPPSAPHGNIDMLDITSLELRSLWISNASALVHLEALAEASALRSVRLLGCRLTSTDRRTLLSLPGRMHVEIED